MSELDDLRLELTMAKLKIVHLEEDIEQRRKNAIAASEAFVALQQRECEVTRARCVAEIELTKLKGRGDGSAVLGAVSVPGDARGSDDQGPERSGAVEPDLSDQPGSLQPLRAVDSSDQGNPCPKE